VELDENRQQVRSRRAMSESATLTCAECGQPLYVGQPMVSGGRDRRMHIGCSVLARIHTQYGSEALRDQETLPPLLRREAA